MRNFSSRYYTKILFETLKIFMSVGARAGLKQENSTTD